MSIQHKIAATLAPAIDCNAPYAKVMIAMLVEVAEEEARRYIPEIERLKVWVAELQSGMYVNCVYCRHRYGPGETTPASMADALKAHVEQCPEHPMSALRAALKPFADYAERIAKDHPGWDHDAFDFQLPDCGPTMRAFRAARAALGKL